jgi:hypothetical protein
LFTVGYFAFDRSSHEAEPLDGETLTMLSEIAATENVGVVAGSIVEDLSASAERGFDTRPRRDWQTLPSSSTGTAAGRESTGNGTSLATGRPSKSWWCPASHSRPSTSRD